VSSILEALKKVEKEAEEKVPRPFEWPQPLDARQSLGRRLQSRQQKRFFSYKNALIFFFSTTLLLLTVLFFPKTVTQNTQPVKTIAPVVVEKKTIQPARKIFFEKTDAGVNAFETVEPDVRKVTDAYQANKTKDAVSGMVDAPEESEATIVMATAGVDGISGELLLKKEESGLLTLHGISWSSEPSKRMAVINSTIAREGRIIEGVRVVRIDKKHVVIEKGGEKLVLTFDKY